jgi:tetratricopeptide (TPR) repeat protein
LPIDDTIRIDALTSWTAHARFAHDARTILETLDQHAELTGASLELRRHRAAAAWDVATDERRRAQVWPDLERELESIRRLAIDDADSDGARAAMLMLAIGLSDHEIVRKPEALQILRDRAAIESVATPEPSAAALEISLLVDLEFITEAERLATRAFDGSHAPILAAPTMRVAEALAARASLAECERASALALNARANVQPTSPEFVDLSRRAAVVLATCNRPAAAIPLLESLLDQHLASDSATTSDIGLQLASLLADAGRLDDAFARLDDTGASTPDALALRGHLLTAAGRHSEAVDDLAQAWHDLAPSTPTWCAATIDLADALSRIEGRRQEARDLLRAIDLLYPDACTSSRDAIDQIRSRLGMGG